MFNNTVGELSALPVAIQSYYREDVRSEPTGNMVDEPYTSIDEEGNETTAYRSVPEMHDVTYLVLIGFGEIQRNVSKVLKLNKPMKQVQRFLQFENNGIDKTFHDEYLKWLASEPEGRELEVKELWQDREPVKPAYKVLDDYPEYVKYQKMQGIEFEGVMCSATKEDMWGLKAIEDQVRAGHPTKFDFDSGESLTLTADNIDAFQKVWIPFRASFFE